MISIQLNGEHRDAPDGALLSELVEQLGIAGQAIAVAVNRRIVRRQDWPGYRLQQHDQIDIVRAIGGG